MAKNIAATVDTVLIIGMPLFICTSFCTSFLITPNTASNEQNFRLYGESQQNPSSSVQKTEPNTIS
jgi:hypothetical protein